MSIKKELKKIAEKNSIIRNIYRKSSVKINKNKYINLAKNIEIDEKLIIFECYMGRSYTCSPKAIYNYMINDKRFKDFRYIWVFKDKSQYKNQIKNTNTKIIEPNTKEYLETYAKAKYWVTNSELPLYIEKKPEQIFIQTWHGTPLKRLRYDINIKGGGSAYNSLKEMREKNDIDTKRYDYFISPSQFASKKFISAFNLKQLNKENIVIETGYPRNDFLFTYKEKEIEKIKTKLKIDKNKKVILYAPTFRDHEHKSGEGYTLKIGIDFEDLKNKFGKDYIILFRAHYFIADRFDFKKYKGFVYNVSDYSEINELYIISDLLITDYSSVFFDYANLKKPIIFYMYDLDAYKNKMRDFYFDLNILPGPIVQNQKELTNEIKNIKNFKYDEKYKKFNNKFNYLDDRNSSKRVIDKVFK